MGLRRTRTDREEDSDRSEGLKCRKNRRSRVELEGGPEKDQSGEGRAGGVNRGLEGRESGRVRKEEVTQTHLSKIACADDDCSACTFRPHVHKFIVGEKVWAGLQVKHTYREL